MEEQGSVMGLKVNLNRKSLAFVMCCLSAAVVLALWIFRLNSLAIAAAGLNIVVAVCVFLGIVFFKKLNAFFLFTYLLLSFGITQYLIFRGVDDSFIWRFCANCLLALPSALIIIGLYYGAIFASKKLQTVVAVVMSILLMGSSVVYLLSMNLKTNPTVKSLQDGHDEYLKNVNKNADASSPNVLFILMDDLGYADVSAYSSRYTNAGALFNTPAIDSVAEDGILMENFYSAYSVCSPARFAALTGRYPYRGYADNVLYPTEKGYLSTTRMFNSFNADANVDGMLGDEITIAETLSAKGYNTAAVGKWHLGDYGEYLPTNQGFDYFFGSYQVNDMNPYYIVEEENGVSETILTDADLRKGKGGSQSDVTKTYHKAMTDWITDAANDDEPFFAYYSTPWPHAPLSVGEEFDGATGLGVYADCVTEFDYYLGQLFQTMKDLGVYDNTIIVFSSDNGPALQGSSGELRGGKYLSYEAGQKVPFMMKWAANPSAIGATADTTTVVTGQAVLTDLFPTLCELCNVTRACGKLYLPSDVDREIDGLSMVKMLKGEVQFIHDKEHPILHMKRQKIKAIQYAIPTADVLTMTAEANNGDYNYNGYQVIQDNVGGYLEFKYFKNVQNDNSAFFDKFRKNWLHILTDDVGEDYNRADVYPEVTEEMRDVFDAWSKKFKDNRRGGYEEYYD